MSGTAQSLIPRPAIDGLLRDASAMAGVRVECRHRVGVATVIARKNATDRLVARVQEGFGIELPRGPRRASLHEVAFIGIAPETWLCTCEETENELTKLLTQRLNGLASVSDQTDGLPILRLSGPRLRVGLSKLIPIDVHPRVFSVGDAAATSAAHIAVTLWRLEDTVEGWPVFEVSFPRSMAGSFWHAFRAAAVN
jgi:methylglutamate dehydrogenase subunit D